MPTLPSRETARSPPTKPSRKKISTTRFKTRRSQTAMSTLLAAQIASANAAVLAGQAAVENAQINLGYTTIYAPVTGLIGFLNYDVGNVVGGPATQVLDTITTIDPIKITFGWTNRRTCLSG